MEKRIKSKTKFLLGTMLLLLIVLVWFLCFSRLGYFLTIQFRGFSEIRSHIYVDENMKSKEEALDIIDAALARGTKFWGEIKSEPVIIITNDEAKLKKLGWTGSPAWANTYILNGAHTYILVTSEGLDVDIAAHELTHAEFHERLYEGRFFSRRSPVPVWFDEGLATQNDYRDKYNDNAWNRVTDQGEKIEDFNQLVTSEQFFTEDIETRRYHYIISKHEVANWLKENGMDQLKALITAVNAGEEFADWYYK